MEAEGKTSKTSIRKHLLIGFVVSLVLLVGVGGWAATTPLSGAVLASGSIVVDSHVKKVQHLTGGIVADIMVKDGYEVSAGEVLVRLDDTQTRANLAIVQKRIDELSGSEARLEAERDGLEKIFFPQSLQGRGDDESIAAIIKGEEKLFKARLTARRGQKNQLSERIVQLREEISGIEAQIDGKRRELVLIEEELSGIRKLHKIGLAPITRLKGLERDAARLEGERGALTASLAQTKGRIAEINLQILQIDGDLQSEVAGKIREIQAQLGEFVERRIAALDQLKQVDIRAPQSGIVHNLAVHAAGAVVSESEQIMLIVPVADALVVEVRVEPQDIDQLYPGQEAMLRFSAFNQRTTPEISGTIDRIGADLTMDQQTGLSYYLVRIATDPTQLDRLGAVDLVPGMPVEAHIRTLDRTALSYLVKPLSDHVERAFREE